MTSQYKNGKKPYMPDTIKLLNLVYNKKNS